MSFLECIKSVGIALVSGISSAVSIVSSFSKEAISVVGETIGRFALDAVKMLNILSIVLPPHLQILVMLTVEVISTVSSALAKMLGITKKEEKSEEVGYRMDEAVRHDDWQQREDFESFQAYYDYLKQQIPDDAIDQEKLERDKIAYTILGSSTLYHEIGGHVKIELPVEFFVGIGLAKMTAEETNAMIEVFKKEGIEGQGIVDFLEGRMLFSEEQRIRNDMETAFQKLYPKKSQQEVQDRLDDIQAANRGKIDKDFPDSENIKTMERLFRSEIDNQRE